MAPVLGWRREEAHVVEPLRWKSKILEGFRSAKVGVAGREWISTWEKDIDMYERTEKQIVVGSKTNERGTCCLFINLTRTHQPLSLTRGLSPFIDTNPVYTAKALLLPYPARI